MPDTNCPKCGHEVAHDTACPGCGHVAANGAVKKVWGKPPPPPEVADWVIHPVPLEFDEEFLRGFDEAEFTAAFREAERAGWPELKDLIDEIERETAPRD